MNSFEIIYDFASGDGIKKFKMLLIPIGIFLVSRFFLFLIKNDKEGNIFKNPLKQKQIAQIIQFCGISFFLLFFVLLVNSYCKTNDLYNNDKLKTEGFVTDFHPMASGGHDTERFIVNGVKFEFSDFEVSGFGYNNAKSHGGVIDENKYVKISYIKMKNSNQILKLEVRK